MAKRAQVTLAATFLGTFIVVIVAAVLVGPLGDEVTQATNSARTNLSTTDSTLLRLWPTFFIIGVLLVILVSAGLS